ncbi:MAG: M20/M25/M40 family metallo-hydrolase, partial [Rikenellaceae bacterium]
NREIEESNYVNKTNKPTLVRSVIPGLFYNEMVDAGILGVIQSADVPLRSLFDRKLVDDPTMTFEKLPTTADIKLDSHQYDIIHQMVEERRSFELEFDIRNNFKLGPVKYCNVVGKIKGSKYPDEYVMVSGHLDALDSGTGAVDCGAGVTPAMEAARMLMAAGARPERSIIFVMFAGEEFGLLGAEAWCKRHKAELPKISNLFNRDGGPTPPVGISVPKSMLKEFEKVCEPISSIRSDIPFKVSVLEPYDKPTTTGGTDATVFQVAGVPAIGLKTKDVLGYNFSYNEIWHTENDIFNKSIPEYQEHTATVTAIIALGVANMSKLLPRAEIYK